MLNKIMRFLGFVSRQELADVVENIRQEFLTVNLHIKNAGKRLDNDQQAIEDLRGRLVVNSHEIAPGFCNSILDVEAKYMIREGAWRDHNDNPTFTNMEMEAGRLLYSLVCLYRPRTILETGTHQGYSSALMAQALLDFKIKGHIWTFDPFMVSHLFENNVLSDFVSWVNDYSTEFNKYNLPDEFDMMILDSDHTYDTLSLEVQLLESRLRVGGVLIFHDTVVFKDLWPVVQAVKESGRFEVVTLDTPRTWCRDDMNGSGITLCRKISAGTPIETQEKYKTNVNIDHFIDDLPSFYKNTAKRSVFFKCG